MLRSATTTCTRRRLDFSRFSNSYNIPSLLTISYRGHASAPAKRERWDELVTGFTPAPPSIPSSHLPKRTSRRQSLTAREMAVFEDMFSLVFQSGSATAGKETTSSGLTDPKNFFSQIRSKSLQSAWTLPTNTELDQKKEEMNNLDTDQELLEWGMIHVFGESERYLQEAVKAVEEQKTPIPALQPPTYPYLIALLMRTFRVKYKDPHLALSIFEYARQLSVASYTFGCSTQAYNELIETRWSALRDLPGVHDALVEMHTNGVPLDARTRQLVGQATKEVGAQHLWAEDSQLESGGTWTLVKKIEDLLRGPRPSSRRSSRVNDWKYDALEDRADDGFGFGKWDTRESLSGGFRPEGSQKV